MYLVTFLLLQATHCIFLVNQRSFFFYYNHIFSIGKEGQCCSHLPSESMRQENVSKSATSGGFRGSNMKGGYLQEFSNTGSTFPRVFPFGTPTVITQFYFLLLCRSEHHLENYTPELLQLQQQVGVCSGWAGDGAVH